MGLEEVDKIKKFFSDGNYSVTYLEHKPVVTSEDAAKTRGFELRQGIKALLFTDTKGNWVIVNVPADKKVDQKKVAELLGWSKNKTRMADASEVLEMTGCEIGAVPPFEHKEKIQILVDKGVYDNQISAFNIGLKTISVKIPTEEMKKIFSEINTIEGKFTRA